MPWAGIALSAFFCISLISAGTGRDLNSARVAHCSWVYLHPLFGSLTSRHVGFEITNPIHELPLAPSDDEGGQSVEKRAEVEKRATRRFQCVHRYIQAPSLLSCGGNSELPHAAKLQSGCGGWH